LSEGCSTLYHKQQKEYHAYNNATVKSSYMLKSDGMERQAVNTPLDQLADLCHL
jgi:hypothetical protein